MPIIKLIGELHPELKSIGLKEGDEKTAMYFPKNENAQFHHVHNGRNYQCSVWKENFEIIDKS